MKIFSFGGSDDDDKLPKELEDLLEAIAGLVADSATINVAGALGIIHGPDISDEQKDQILADHVRVEQLAIHMDRLDDDARNTDGNKLRYLAMEGYKKDILGDGCIHGNQVSEDLLEMADRLDELDLKESEIGA